jgi:hypothetical protein
VFCGKTNDWGSERRLFGSGENEARNRTLNRNVQIMIARLNRLIKQAEAFNNSSSDTPEFRVWWTNVLRFMEEKYGKESREFGSFNNIVFNSVFNEDRPSNYQIIFKESLQTAILYLKNYLVELKSEKKKEREQMKMIEPVPDKPVIFLSHRSTDKEYGDALRELICGIGVKNGQLIYTSHPLHKIPLDENIFEYLRKNLSNSVYVVFLLSNEYFDSSACLNEMGAAWLAQKDYTNVFVPEFDFSNKKFQGCVIDKSKMGISLTGDNDCKSRIIDFKNKIIKLCNLQIDEQAWMVLLDIFIAACQKIAQTRSISNGNEPIDYKSKNVPAASPKQNDRPVLSDKARELLKEISFSKDGTLLVTETDGEYDVETNGKNLGCDPNDARTRAVIESAIEELERNKYIKAMNNKREVFKITKAGYDIADTI